jgi:hypothetical protein
MLARRVIGKPKGIPVSVTLIPLVRRVLGKPKGSVAVATPEPEPVAAPVPEPTQVKRVLGKPKLPVPPVPPPGTYMTKTMESFEALREYYTERSEVIPQSVIKWYHAELALEKKEFDDFWSRCAATKACIDGTLRGDDLWIIDLAVNAARQAEKKLPILESDIGEMPAYGTGEFWAWCHKRKKLKEQKEAAIIAAGGTVPLPKPKKSKKLKA